MNGNAKVFLKGMGNMVFADEEVLSKAVERDVLLEILIDIGHHLLKKRLAACRDAIMMNEKISEVCLSYGFKDYPSFFRAFRKEFGMSPKEYREAFSLAELQPDNP